MAYQIYCLQFLSHLIIIKTKGVLPKAYMTLDLTIHASLSPIRPGFAPCFVNYKKGALDSQPQVIKFTSCLSYGGWFSSGTPASSTTKTGRHDIAEILLKVALKHQQSIKSIIYDLNRCMAIIFSLFGFLASIDLLVIIDTVTEACGMMCKPYLNSNIIFFM